MTHSPQRRGHSTIELLVAMGVIAAVMVLLIVSLRSASRSARNAKSITNLRQLGAILSIYASDHNQIIPSKSETALNEQGNPFTKWAWHGALHAAGLLPDPEILINPKDGPPSLSRWAKENNLKITSMEVPIFGYRDFAPFDGKPKKVTSIPSAAQFFIITESWRPEINRPGYFIGINATGRSWRVKLDERNLANTLFLDGHVEAKPREYFETLHLTQPTYTTGPISTWPPPSSPD